MKWSTFFSRARVLGALLLCIILHAGIDGGLVFTDIFSITHRASAEMAGTLYLSVSVIISVALFAAVLAAAQCARQFFEQASLIEHG